MDCGIHAREWIAPAFCQFFVREVGERMKSCEAIKMTLFGFRSIFIQKKHKGFITGVCLPFFSTPDSASLQNRPKNE